MPFVDDTPGTRPDGRWWQAIVKKDMLEKKRRAQRESLERSTAAYRWWHDSTARRVTRAVTDSINPFDNLFSARTLV